MFESVSGELLAYIGVVQALLAALGTALLKLVVEKDLDAARAKLKVDGDRLAHAQKSSYDTEVGIYRKLWEATVSLRAELGPTYRALLQLQSRKHEPADDRCPLQERAAERELEGDPMEKVASLVGQLTHTIEINRPFFAANVAEACFAFVKEAELAKAHSEKAYGDLHKKWREGQRETLAVKLRIAIGRSDASKQYVQRLSEHTDHICEAIRLRLTGVSAEGVLSSQNNEEPR